MIAVGDSRLRTCAGQRLFLRLPDKPQGRAGLAAHGLEHVPVSRQRVADFPRFCGAGPADTCDQGPAKGIAKRRSQRMTELRSLALGSVILGALLPGPFGAIAAGPDAPVSDRELVLGLRVVPPFVMKTPDGIWTGISVELSLHPFPLGFCLESSGWCCRSA
jgi:hypothetical protein